MELRKILIAAFLIGITLQVSSSQESSSTVWSVWSEWSACSGICGNGSMRQRKRQCSPRDGGCEGSATETASCNLTACTFSKWNAWDAWSSCSSSCGGGSRVRMRTCNVGNSGNKPCSGESSESSQCHTSACPTYDQWTAWTTCSVTCGSGYRSRSRSCSSGRDDDCGGYGYDGRECNVPRCPAWSAWSTWSACSVSCGGGSKKRDRQCSTRDGGCHGSNTNTINCNLGICTFSNWMAWNTWGTCSKTCGGGRRKRMRTCNVGNSGKKPCSGRNKESSQCHISACPTYDQWTAWTTCSVTCGSGYRSRSRSCSSGRDDDCGGYGYDGRVCNVPRCPGPPVIKMGTKYVKAPTNNKVVFKCSFTGRPAPNITWLLSNGSSLPKSSQFEVGDLKQRDYKTTSILTVYGMQCKETSLLGYICSATNRYAENGVRSDIFYPSIDINTLTWSNRLVSCKEASDTCNRIGNELVVVPSRSVFRNIHGTNRWRYYWVSSKSAQYFTKDGITPNSDGCIRMYNDNWSSYQNEYAVAVCEARSSLQSTRLLPRPYECDGTRLNISWQIEPGATTIPHKVIVDGDVIVSTAPGVTSAVADHLKPRSSYKVQVRPLFYGCEITDLVGGKTVRTGRGRLESSQVVSWRYDSGINRCYLHWNSSQPENEVAMFQIVVTCSVNGNLSEAITKSCGSIRANVSKNERSHYIENLLPNTRYQVKVGLLPSSPCDGTIAAAWSDVQRDGCVTKPASPGSVQFPSISSNNSSNDVALTFHPINERNGLISCFILVLQKIDNNGSTVSMETNVSRLIQADEHFNNSYPFIVLAIPRFSQDFDLILGDDRMSCCDAAKIGSEANCTTKNNTSARNRRELDSRVTGRNRELEPGSNYSYYVIVATPSGDDVLFTSSNQSQPFTCNTQTVVVIQQSSLGFVGNTGAMVALVASFLMVIVFCSVMWTIYKKRMWMFKKDSPAISTSDHVMFSISYRENDGSFDSSDQNVDDVAYGNSPAPRCSDFTKYLIPASEILDTYKSKRRANDRGFHDEFKVALPAVVQAGEVETSYAKKEENKTKNRFRNILPSDRARVVLKNMNNQPYSDYVNASYIDGVSESSKFIAAQGPKPNTVHDFWRMIVENKCRVIVMLTKLREDKVKCERYWPDQSEVMEYGRIRIVGKQRISYGEFFCTMMRAENLVDNTSTEISHFQYMNWPDHGIPSTTSTLLRFYKAVCNAMPNDSDAPMLVHCSAGVGRTGTFISLDILSEQLRREGQINVFEMVYKMRLNRTEMVQSLGQYIYIHKLLAEIQTYGETDVEVSAFLAYEASLLRASSSHRKRCGIQEQFQLLSAVPPSFSDTNEAKKSCNMKWNFVKQLLPYDHNLSYLQYQPPDEERPYINASNIQIYTADCFFIIAQDVHQSNINLFWRCVIENEVDCIVMISREEDVAQYWGSAGEWITFDDVAVVMTNESEHDGFIERDVEVRNQELLREKSVKQIVMNAWPADEAPPSIASLLKVVSILCKSAARAREVKGKKFPALIHCKDGSNQATTLCGIYNLIERVKNENMVDVFRAVKDVRDLRMGGVSHIKQYELCYAAVREFIRSFDLYGNFK